MNLAKRSNLRWTVILVGLPFLFIWTSPSAGQDFDMACNYINPAPPGPPCDDATPSLGSFRIYVRWPYHGLMVGYPGYDPVTHILESPTLFEFATVIGRSVAHLEDSTGPNSDIDGTPVGSRRVMISDSDFDFVPPGFGVTGGREVHLEVYSLWMSDFGGGAAVRAGENPFFGLPLSPGEVESQSASGVPADDFPARGFFNMYVEVDIPLGGAFPGATVYNPGPGDPYPSRPMVVLAPNEWSFPPSVVYVHGQTNAPPVRFRFASAFWDANDLFGWLSMAAHMTDPPMVCAEPGQCPVDAIDGCCGTCDPEFECCCPSVQAEASMLAEMEAEGEIPHPSCGNGVYEPENEEECDNGDDALCPGRCQAHCTCAPPPIPTVSEWGLVVLTLAGLAIGTIVLGQRRRKGAVG